MRSLLLSQTPMPTPMYECSRNYGHSLCQHGPAGRIGRAGFERRICRLHLNDRYSTEYPRRENLWQEELGQRAASSWRQSSSKSGEHWGTGDIGVKAFSASYSMVNYARLEESSFRTEGGVK
jgi:hypothetical protein